MSRERLDPLEDAFVRLRSAEEAGVFRSTKLAQDALFPMPTPRQSSRQFSRLRLWAPISAAALLAIGVWGFLFQRELSSIRARRSVPAENVRVAHAQGLAGCLAGPGSQVTSGCVGHDRDADGDVDLADFSFQQVESESARR